MTYDVVIVGGSVIGSAIAYWLRRLEPGLRIVVVERDPTFEFSSTLRSDGNVRIQFNLEENIRMSQYALEVLETFADDFAVGGVRPEPDAKHQGNLFMAGPGGEAATRVGIETQRALGCDVEWLDASDVTGRWPVLASVGLVGGSFSQVDGSVDPSAVLRGFRTKAAELGAETREGDVARITVAGSAVTGVTLGDGTTIRAPVVVNAAGAWAGGLCATAGVDLPVEPVMRTVYTVDTGIDAGGLPSLFLPSGLYVLPEAGTTFLIAWSQPDDPVGFDFRFSRAGFDDRIWPELVAHFRSFDRLQVTGGWRGLYAVNTLDGNAILGEWPRLRGLFLANGFSGHGFQQSPAVGRYLAELITDHAPALDLARLGPQRILEGRPLFEHAGRII